MALLFLASSAADVSAYTLISNKGRPAYWPNHRANYRFNTTPSGYFTGGVDFSGTHSDEFEPIRRGFATWVNLSGVNFTVTETASTTQSANSDDHLNTIQWVPSGWRQLSFRPPSNALAVTLLSFDSDSGVIEDADIYFNADSFQWAVVDSSSEANYVDVQNIATHEIGHYFGLDHSSENIFEEDLDLKDATMFYASSTGETEHRNLKDDDVKAMTALYGSSSRGTPAISSVQVLSNTSGTVRYAIKGSGFNEYTSFVLSKHSASESDIVSRYRTISSSTEAIAEFDLLGMSGGEAALIVFNDPENPVETSIDLSSVAFQATNVGGGGGGCSLSQNPSPSTALFALGLVSMLLIVNLRRKVSRRSH